MEHILVSGKLAELSHVDNEIKKLNTLLHTLKAKRKILTFNVLDYMKRMDIPAFKFNGKTYTKKLIKVPMSKKEKIERCSYLLNNAPPPSRMDDNFVKNLLYVKGSEYKEILDIKNTRDE